MEGYTPFELGLFDRIDELKKEVEQLKCEIRMLEKQCTRAQDVAEELYKRQAQIQCCGCGVKLNEYAIQENLKRTNDFDKMNCYDCVCKRARDF